MYLLAWGAERGAPQVSGWEPQPDSQAEAEGRPLKLQPDAGLFLFRLEVNAADGCWRLRSLRRLANVPKGA